MNSAKVNVLAKLVSLIESHVKLSEECKKAINAFIKKETKKESKKDPSAPKGAKNAYILFCTDARAKAKEENPSHSGKQIMSDLGAMWRALSDEEKAEYQEMAVEDKKRYLSEKESYSSSSGSDSSDTSDAEEAVSSTSTRETSKASKPKGTKPKGPKGDKPKKALSGYLFFCQEQRPLLKEAGVTSKEMMKALGDAWKSLSEGEKGEYGMRAKSAFSEEKYGTGSSRTDSSRTDAQSSDDDPISEEEISIAVEALDAEILKVKEILEPKKKSSKATKATKAT